MLVRNGKTGKMIEVLGVFQSEKGRFFSTPTLRNTAVQILTYDSDAPFEWTGREFNRSGYRVALKPGWELINPKTRGAKICGSIC